MRTTVTLDEDVAQLLRDAMHASRRSFKETLNEAVRAGLSQREGLPQPRPFVVKARPLGLRAGIDPTRLNQLADEMEVDAILEGMGWSSRT